ncbi:alpha/beta fold hydrolase [Shewanella sp. JM162201]|uniref:Alpha/beta fold hydrolase n=1 Tax=Shewanella jiangmenensis TaxID=2837387 RepID=A0ABS5V5G8_9GAMM|nr:alpha/beta fold hydrolase [Shewanella jiangmenensis]MBT1445705.1 alpha/beta fold hydrolase [Shewanella jiangmenensis]
MKTLLIRTSKHLLIAAVYASLGVVVTALGFGIWFLNAKPDLNAWHTTVLENRFTHKSKVTDFEGYLALEKALKAELEHKIFKGADAATAQVNRYVRGSLSDPRHWVRDWNWSFEWPNEEAKYGVLLIHGMSDSPYSMSSIARDLRDNAHVLGLRLPGHGTLPSGLTTLDWRDLSASVTVAINHMKQRLGDRPLYIIGFSTGAALALNHELERVAAGEASASSGMVFLSPAIGLAPVAAGARWQARLGEWLGLEKLAWNYVGIEYDPFKYVSFAVNAGDVVYQLAERNRLTLSQLSADAKARLPSILSFQSVVDDTVSTRAVIEDLYLQLGNTRHKLVLFDVNRTPVNLRLMQTDPRATLEPSLRAAAAMATITLVENEAQQASVALLTLATEASLDAPARPLGLAWPENIYSLSHVALPFSKDDSLYGLGQIPNSNRIQIGAAASRGERGIFGVPADEMLRQKWNPFYHFQQSEIEAWFETPLSGKDALIKPAEPAGKSPQAVSAG